MTDTTNALTFQMLWREAANRPGPLPATLHAIGNLKFDPPASVEDVRIFDNALTDQVEIGITVWTHPHGQPHDPGVDMIDINAAQEIMVQFHIPPVAT